MRHFESITVRRAHGVLLGANFKLAVVAILVVFISQLLSENSVAQKRGRRKDLPADLQRKIDASVRKASDFVKSQLKGTKQSGFASLGVYALMSANEYLKKDVIDAVSQSVLDHIVSKFDNDGEYVPRMRSKRVYEAGVDLLALCKAHKYNPIYYSRIQAIVRFLQKDQDESGFWSYPDALRDKGDTSMTQYAVLGLWAAEELADVRVPSSVWQKAVRWHVNSQSSTGGFAYHPFTGEGNPTLTMTSAGLGSLFISRKVMSGSRGKRDTKKKKKRSRKFRDLKVAETGKTGKELEEERKKKKENKGRAAISFDTGSINAAIGSAQKWLGSNFLLPSHKYPIYYLYSVERIGYFMGDTIFGRDWYVEGSTFLIEQQQEDGFWLGSTQKIATASYGILFLTRATEHIDPSLGLVGGNMRGNSGGFDPRKITGSKNGKLILTKTQKALEDRLRSLEISENVDVTDLLIPQIVKEIEFDPSKKKILLKNAKLMKKLLRHSKWELRQIAVWALGKTGTIDDVPTLINSLKDLQPDVMREAHLALCYISRKPLGPKDKYGKYLPIGPLEKIAKKASSVQKKQAAQQWSREAVERWNAWYFRIRPYEQRDDLKDGKRKTKATTRKS